MSFLQPWVLFALPILALPIVIHLIHQRRFQTVQWAAMQFLLTANKMSRGYARLRQWLILALRTLAIAGLLFAVARPLSSGMLGIAAGGRVDTTIVLLDRSASMEQRSENGDSKLDAGLNQLIDSLSLLKSNRYVLIDSASTEPIEFQHPEELRVLTSESTVSATANIPEMMKVTADYLKVNQPSRCEVWICSDVRESDWQSQSGRWETIRGEIARMPQMVRFHLLAYPELDRSNRSIRVTAVRRVQKERNAELLLSLQIRRSAEETSNAMIPVQIEIDGVRSEFDVEIQGSQLDLVNFAVPLDREQRKGWGRVSIPSDGYASDNEYYFVYGVARDRRVLIVAEDSDAVVPIRLVASVPPSPESTCSARVISPAEAVVGEADDAALVVWQAPIPSESSRLAEWLQQFDRPILFVPPRSIAGESFAGVRWARWEEAPISVSTWVGDQGLLAATQDGAALPVERLSVQRYARTEGDVTPFAMLGDKQPLLSGVSNRDRDVFFLATTCAPEDSSLASNGVVLYAIIQRAIDIGMERLRDVQQLDAGALASDQGHTWTKLSGKESSWSNLHKLNAGIYQAGDELYAINRSELEDDSAVVPSDQVAALFENLSFDRIDDRAENTQSLLREIWRAFLLLMLLALIGEAALCLPKRSANSSDDTQRAFGDLAATAPGADKGMSFRDSDRTFGAGAKS